MPVSPANVQAVIDTALSPTDIQPYVDRAADEVDRRESEQEGALSDKRRDEIVALLAAHYIRSLRIDEREVSSQNIGGQSVTYAGDHGRDLMRTTPGEHVMRISPTGFFAGATYTVTAGDVEED